MRFIGRTTAPILSYLIVEGFHHTRNRWRYIRRLAVFAIISQPFYYIMVFRQTPWLSNNAAEFLTALNVMYTFAVSLLILTIVECGKINVYVKTLLIGSCFALSAFGDWTYFIPVWALIFHKFRGSFKKQAVVFAVLSLMMIAHRGGDFNDFLIHSGILLAVIPLCLYNGKRGGFGGRVAAVSKWGHYCYYPLHMAVLIALK
jgi:hypothetical protein